MVARLGVQNTRNLQYVLICIALVITGVVPLIVVALHPFEVVEISLKYVLPVLVLSLVGTVACNIGFVVLRRRERVWIAESLQRRKLPCPGCLYELSDIVPSMSEASSRIVCPECGRSCIAGEIRRAWRDRYNSTRH
ncbi:MAG: hypothetical protein K2X32_14425 [Phycisphaerales bacterium]|nr:hypothetical protein [Phycisphaerales bacterium]